MADTKKTAKVKKPSALKRDIQSEKNRMRNKTYKAMVNTAIKSFQQSLTQKEGANTAEKLQAVYSLMDKGVKKGIFPKNKASRTKASLAQKVSA